MSQLLQHGAFPMFAICASYLVLLMIVIGHLTGFVRIKTGHAANEEDFDAFRLENGDTSEVDPSVARYERLHRNHLESTLPFLAFGLVYLATDPGTGLATGLFVIFTLMRTVFTVCYVKAIQPIRSLSFVVGEICVIVMVLQAAWYGLGKL